MTDPTTNTIKLLLAGAGTGKTHLLTLHFIKCIASLKKALAITFSQKATQEIKTRIFNSILKNNIPTNSLFDLPIYTFHSFCLQLNYALHQTQINTLSNNIHLLQNLTFNILFLKKSPHHKIRKTHLSNMSNILDKIQENNLRAFTAIKTQTAILNLKSKIKFFFLLNNPNNTATTLENILLNLYFTTVTNNRHINYQKLLDQYIPQKQNNFTHCLHSIKSTLLSISFNTQSKFIYNIFETLFFKNKQDKTLSLSEIITETSYLFKNRTLLHNFTDIFIDEYQDTSPSQNNLILSLYSHKTYISLIGDPKQSIYAFRGSSPIYKWNHHQQSLSISRRSTPSIITLANIIAASSLSRINYIDLLNSMHNIKSTAGGILNNSWQDLIKSLVKTKKYHPSNIAILTHRNKTLHTIKKELKNIGIDSSPIYSNNLYNQDEIIDIITILYILNLHTSYFFKIQTFILPLINTKQIQFIITPSFLASLQSMLGRKPLHIIINRILIEGRYINLLKQNHNFEQQMSNINNLLEIISLQSLENFQQTITSLWNLIKSPYKAINQEKYNTNNSTINLMTIHQSKGLEFKIVILTDLNFAHKLEHDLILFNPLFHNTPQVNNEKKTIPFKYQCSIQKNINNEKKTLELELARLLYVGITRSQDFIYILPSKTNKNTTSMEILLKQTAASNPFLFNFLMPSI